MSKNDTKIEYVCFTISDIGSEYHYDYDQDYESATMKDLTRVLLTRTEAKLLAEYMKKVKKNHYFRLIEVVDQKSIDAILQDAVEWKRKELDDAEIKAAEARERARKREEARAEKALKRKRLLLEELKKELNEG